jgi:hypothetical protein
MYKRENDKWKVIMDKQRYQTIPFKTLKLEIEERRENLDKLAYHADEARRTLARHPTLTLERYHTQLYTQLKSDKNTLTLPERNLTRQPKERRVRRELAELEHRRRQLIEELHDC